jgi:hypothetical protein
MKTSTLALLLTITGCGVAAPEYAQDPQPQTAAPVAANVVPKRSRIIGYCSEIPTQPNVIVAYNEASLAGEDPPVDFLNNIKAGCALQAGTWTWGEGWGL